MRFVETDYSVQLPAGNGRKRVHSVAYFLHTALHVWNENHVGCHLIQAVEMHPVFIAECFVCCCNLLICCILKF